MPSAWRDSFLQVPRHRFIPDTIWVRNADGQPAPLRRDDDPAEWLHACYTDAPIAVQLDDGDGSERGYVTSTASMPTVVAMMLEAADLSPGLSVLEIGTGSGYNAALLASVVGAENVTTIEIDTQLAERATTALQQTGWPIEVVTGDGEKGYPPQAPFDRVMATAAVNAVPYAWVEQTRPGGILVVPFGTAFHSGALLRLLVDRGEAVGRFDGDAAFMWTRAQRLPHGSVEERVQAEHDVSEATTPLHPYEPVGDFDASFAIGLRVPGMMSTLVYDHDDPTSQRYTVYLMNPDSQSWASWRVEPGLAEYPVRQHGSRRLFTELQSAYRWWVEVGRPPHTRFGVTVAPDEQRAWLDTPDNTLPIL
jgi:protein-L-isoaspartate(D-aspartate) O-methyltransferase